MQTPVGSVTYTAQRTYYHTRICKVRSKMWPSCFNTLDLTNDSIIDLASLVSFALDVTWQKIDGSLPLRFPKHTVHSFSTHCCAYLIISSWASIIIQNRWLKLDNCIYPSFVASLHLTKSLSRQNCFTTLFPTPFDSFNHVRICPSWLHCLKLFEHDRYSWPRALAIQASY